MVFFFFCVQNRVHWERYVVGSTVGSFEQAALEVGTLGKILNH